MIGRKKFSVETLASLHTEWMAALHAAKMDMDIAELLDACIVIESIESVLKQHRDRCDIVLDDEALKSLMQTLMERYYFQEIRHTLWLYTKNTVNLTNQYCVKLAEHLQMATGRNRFQILMPSLENIESAITGTNLNENGIGVTDFILADKRGYFIEIEECLKTAEVDLSLLHTQYVSETRKAVKLSDTEKAAVLAHSQEAKELYKAIEKRYRFMHKGQTLGALMQRLIDGLNQGGAHKHGTEMNAGVDATMAIFNFAQVVEKLSPDVRTWLMRLKTASYRDDNYHFEYFWKKLSSNQEAKIAAIRADQSLSKYAKQTKIADVYKGTDTCVQLAANNIRMILDANRNELFKRYVKTADIRTDGLSIYDKAVDDAWHWLRTRFIHLRNGGYTLSPSIDGEARNDWCRKVAAHLNELYDVQFKRVLEIFVQLNVVHVNASLELLLQSLTSTRRNKCLIIMRPMLEGRQVVSVAVGDDHTISLTRAGEVYTCGRNGYGQLGSGNYQWQDSLTLVPGLHDIVQVGAGVDHSVFLTRAGEVYACGRNSDGQLGLNDIHKRNVPTLVPGLPAIAKVVVKNFHTFFLTHAGEVYACGRNHSDQLGLGNLQQHHKPTLVTGLPAIADVIAHVNYTVFVTCKGGQYTCGAPKGGSVMSFIGTPRPTLVSGSNEYINGLLEKLDAKQDKRVAAFGAATFFAPAAAAGNAGSPPCDSHFELRRS